ncbi:MAG: SpoIIE family protein phosphatase [Chloroflexota bacterium]|nr:MAG: SpoIIE family protein phosphatase [Chloroflexota bacterium]
MKENWVDRLALRVRPEIEETSGLDRAGRLLDISALLTTLPLLIVSLIWLVWLTDVATLVQSWPELVVYFILLAIFTRYTFELRLQMTASFFASASGTLEPMVAWSGALIFGPSVLWIYIILSSVIYVNRIRRESSIDYRWSLFRNYVSDLTFTILGTLVGLTVYQWLGGVLPFPGLQTSYFWAALVGSLAYLVTVSILIIPFARRLIAIYAAYQGEIVTRPLAVIRFLFLGINMSYVALPFAILAAGLYGDHGLGAYLFFMIAAFLSAVLAHRLSQSASHSEQRSKELAVLESLGRSIIDAPPDDPNALPELLSEHLAGMLPRSLLYIWLDPDTILYQTETTSEFPETDKARQLAQKGSQPYYQLSQVRLAEERLGRITRKGLIVPVVAEDGEIRGGIYVLKREDYGDVMDFLPAVQSLAAQIASALRRAEVYEQTVQSVKMARELEVAGEIQATFLPNSLPDVPGWEISAALEPARQTSGDFYDFVDLDGGRIGIIVADVADKGTGAALYMALSRTLIRTYAMQHPDHPEMALQMTNERILQDTESDQFVTVFFGVLDASNGQLTYANAGHNPAYLINNGRNVAPQELSRTGIPLGMFPEMGWRQNVVQMNPGDILIAYTDGVTEAQNVDGQEFGEKRLLDAVDEGMLAGRAVRDMASLISLSVHEFAGEAPQFDDITLMLVQRSLDGQRLPGR